MIIMCPSSAVFSTIGKRVRRMCRSCKIALNPTLMDINEQIFSCSRFALAICSPNWQLLPPPLIQWRTDPFGQGVSIFMGKTNTRLCPVSAILNYLVVRPPGDGQWLIHKDSSPLPRDWFVRMVNTTLKAAGIDSTSYSGHSFQIGAASAAASVGVPAYFIKMLGRWESEAYLLCIRTTRECLASMSHLSSPSPPLTLCHILYVPWVTLVCMYVAPCSCLSVPPFFPQHTPMVTYQSSALSYN